MRWADGVCVRRLRADTQQLLRKRRAGGRSAPSWRLLATLRVLHLSAPLACILSPACYAEQKKAVSEEALNPSTLPSCCAEPAMATMLSSCLALQVGRETQAERCRPYCVEGTKQ